MQKNVSGGKAPAKRALTRGSGASRQIGNKIPSNSKQAAGVTAMAKASQRLRGR